MSNNSATGGYLLPATTEQFPGNLTLDQFIQTVLVGISGLPGTLVRPDWQVDPPKNPDIGVNWLAYGIVLDSPNANAFVGMDENGIQFSQRHQDIFVQCKFYGPDAQNYANIVQDGFQITQNLAPLTSANMGYVSTGNQIPIPDLINERWFYRIEMEIRLRRELIRTYPILPLLGARGQLFSSSPAGYVADWSAIPQLKWSTFDTLRFPPTSQDTEAYAMCYDFNGNLYVAGLSSNDDESKYYILIRKYDGKSWSTSDLFGPDDTTYAQATGLCTDPKSGNIYSCGEVYNSNTGISGWIVRKFDGTSWTTIDLISSPTFQNNATQCVCDSKGNLYVCGNAFGVSQAEWCVRKFDGTSWTTIDLILNPNSFANGICVDKDDNIYVIGRLSNTYNVWTVKKFDGVSWTISDQFSSPNFLDTYGNGLFTDNNGNVYAVGYASAPGAGYFWITRKFDGNSWSTVDTFALLPGTSTNTAFNGCCDPTNNLFVCGTSFDYNTNIEYWVVRKFDGTSWTTSDTFASNGNNFSQSSANYLISNRIGTIYACGYTISTNFYEWIIREYS